MGRYSVSNKCSYNCNGRLVRLIRQKQGLTQAELAQLSGYSVRLIGKAEAGKVLSAGAIEVLAQALSTNQRELKPADLILDSLALAENYFSTLSDFERGAIAQCEHFLSESFVLRVIIDQGIVDIDQEYTGIDGLRSYYQKFFHHFRTSAPANGKAQVAQCRFFESEADIVVWQDTQWSLFDCEGGENRTAKVTTRLNFQEGLLCEQEDRVVIS